MKLMLGGRELRHHEPDFALAADSLVLADGTLWSHAATMGAFTKGAEFSIDQSTIENFVKVFSSGYPQEIPVDYEHASTTDDPEVRKLRAQGKIPKAGDVAELRGVFSADQFTGELKAAAEKLSQLAGRPLDDSRNLGLWMRWKPTANALSAIKAGEFSELSIAFDEDWPHNTTGEGQGPAVLAVGCVTRPFLDDMLSVAASSDPHQASGNRPGADHSHETPVMNQKLISLVAALRSKSVATEDEAITELTAHQSELTELRSLVPFRDVISAEFSNEKDPAKIVAALRELRAKVTQAETAAKDAKTKELKATVDATMEKHKAKLTVPLRELMATQLTTELEAGAKVEDSKTVKALESMKSLNIFTQQAEADIGGAGAGEDVKIDARAKELMDSDPTLKALAAKNYVEAYKRASNMASREILALAN